MFSMASWVKRVRRQESHKERHSPCSLSSCCQADSIVGFVFLDAALDAADLNPVTGLQSSLPPRAAAR